MLTTGPKDHVRHSILSMMFHDDPTVQGDAPKMSTEQEITSQNVRRRFKKLSGQLDSLRPFKGMEERLENREKADSQQPPDSQELTNPVKVSATGTHDAQSHQ